MSRKTLMIGLGGTGSKVIALMRKMIKEHGEDESNIRFVGLDTDTDNSGRENIPVIFTSTSRSIDEYVKAMPECKEWFDGYHALMDRMLNIGTGTMRMLSRLAFTETIKTGRLYELEKAISELIIFDGDNKFEFRVVIVTSLAGGTGSGMFMQCALWIRKHLMERYHIKPCLVKGIFAMPEIFTHDISAADERHLTMYANAYACIKELSAVNVCCMFDRDSEDGSAGKIHMKIDDLFDSEHCEKTHQPFDFIFFVDRDNQNYTHLRYIDDYIEQMASIAYMQTFVKHDQFGAYDDYMIDGVTSIQFRLSHGFHRIYGTSGVAKLIYPYDAITEYVGKSITRDAVSAIWRQIDDLFEADNAELIQKRRLDPSVSLLDRGKYFVTKIEEQMIPVVSPLHFVKDDITETRETEDGIGFETIDKVPLFTSAIECFVEGKLNDDGKINDLLRKADPGVRSDYRGMESRIIQSKEDSIRQLKAECDRQIDCFSIMTANQILPDDLQLWDDTKEYSVAHLLRRHYPNDKEFVHPVSVRYLLYRFLNYLTETRAEKRDELDETTEKIFGYASDFKVRTDNGDFTQGSAIDAVNAVLRHKGLFGSNVTRFIDDYIDRAAFQISCIKRYAQAKMYVSVYSELITRVAALLRQYEYLFYKVREIDKEYAEENSELIKALEDSNPMNTYVGVSPGDLRITLQEVRERIDIAPNCKETDGRANAAIFEALFRESSRWISHTRNEACGKEDYYPPFNFRRLFDKTVLENNKNYIQDECRSILDIDIYTAMRKSLDIADSVSDDDIVHEMALAYIRPTYEKAAPYLVHDEADPFSVDTPVINTCIWQSGTDIKSYFNDNPNNFLCLSDLSFYPETRELIMNSSYSKRELACYRTDYAFSLKSVPQFKDDEDNSYYRSYMEAINALTPVSLCTSPHIDKEWHKKSHIPPLKELI